MAPLCRCCGCTSSFFHCMILYNSTPCAAASTCQHIQIQNEASVDMLPCCPFCMGAYDPQTLRHHHPPQQVHGALFAVHCLGMLGGDRAATTAGAVLCKTVFVQPEACSIVLSQLTRRNPREIVAPVRTPVLLRPCCVSLS
jgi:hypothetical protein